MRASASRYTALAGAAAALALALGGCTEEPSFEAEEFVEEVNAEGVELELGEPLITDQEGKELYAVELAPLPGAELPGGREHDHVGGSLSVYEEAGDAGEGLRSCEASADLLCYRLANVVVVLEGGGIEAQRLGVAMERLAEED